MIALKYERDVCVCLCVSEYKQVCDGLETHILVSPEKRKSGTDSILLMCTDLAFTILGRAKSYYIILDPSESRKVKFTLVCLHPFFLTTQKQIYLTLKSQGIKTVDFLGINQQREITN